ncbi:hypothetical protein L1887_00615 [Cichorium endivia]|nr:hypothetical protein L1887_00615 [Cichorium endivia]
MLWDENYSDESDSMHHCFVIHKEHFAIVLYRVHELLRFRIVKESICRFVYLYLPSCPWTLGFIFLIRFRLHFLRVSFVLRYDDGLV